MSDAYAEKVQGERPNAEPEPVAQAQTLTITLQPNGIDVTISGPIKNDTLCYAMLEKARSHIQNIHLIRYLEHQAQAANGQGIAGLLKKMGRG